MAEIIEREGADITYQHMLPAYEVPSEIQKFYDGSHILLTGGSGFLGNLIIQKLILDCPGVSKIYILMRQKKGKTPEERFDDMFKDIVFEKMKIKHPNFHEKIQLMTGDCEKVGLGLSEEDKELLLEQVNIVLHAAATVRFDEKIKVATAINVRATKDLIFLAKNMHNLKAFVHISTAYSHCVRTSIDECFYETNIKPDVLIRITDLLNDEQLEALTPILLKSWPNTYAFTKAIAEKVIQENGTNLPISIVRPSIVISTYKEPVSGWINNYYGPIGICVGTGIGLLRTLNCEPDNVADMVPADYCVNSIIVAAWEVGKSFKNKTNNETVNNVVFDELQVQNNIPIFNFVSSQENRITWREFCHLCHENGLKIPSMQSVWYVYLFLIPNKYLNLFFQLLLHQIPAYAVDFVLLVLGKKPLMVKAYKKIHKFSDVISYFACREWIFKNENTKVLWSKLNATDKKLFTFSMKELQWIEYFHTFIRGARVYLLKEPLENVKQAKKRYQKLKIAHYCILSVFWYFMIKLVWIIIPVFF